MVLLELLFLLAFPPWNVLSFPPWFMVHDGENPIGLLLPLVLTLKILFSQPHSNRCRPNSSRYLKWFLAKFFYMWWTFCNLIFSWNDICDKVGVIMVSVAVATDTEVRTVLQVPHSVSLGLLVFHSISLGFQVSHSVSLGILGFQSIPHSFIAFHGSSPGL